MKAIGHFLKANWLNILIIEILILCASLAGYSFTPFIRAINKWWGIVFAILFVIFSIASLILIFILFSKYDKQKEDKKNKSNARFFFFVTVLIINGLIITIIMLIIRIINPNTQYLIQGLASILCLVFYYLLVGLTIFSNQILNAVSSKKRKN